MKRDQVLSLLNSAGLVQMMGELQQKLVLGAVNVLSGATRSQVQKDAKWEDRFLLDSVGPAAAAAAVDVAVRTCRAAGNYNAVTFTGNYVHNVQAVQNDVVGDYQPFSSVLRQFLLPRYAYLDFDTVVDPRHNVDLECGYPKFITPIMYRYLYDRDDTARRIVDIYPDESWAMDPLVTDTEDENEMTPFKEDWARLCEDFNLLQYLYRIDRLAGVGHYGALLLGVDDGADLEKPIDERELLLGVRRSASSKPRNLLFLRPFDEYLSFIHQYETDTLHPRYGLPKFYNLVFLDMTIDAAGASIGTRLNRRVHWSRVVHVADNLVSSLVFGTPRQQPAFNRLLDLRKIKGGSAEMFWKGGFPGLSFEVDPKFVADEPDFDEEKFRQEIETYASGLRRWITTLGVKVNSLAPNIAENPDRYVDIQVKAIAMLYGIPHRIFVGSEEGRLASSQDKRTWDSRLMRRLKTFVAPSVVRNTVDRFVAVGIMRPPRDGRYKVGWPDLGTPTDEDKANLALKFTQAMSQYVASGAVHLMAPQDYLTVVFGMQPSEALRCIATAKEQGDWQKLFKVDPSQGAGVNGKRQNIAAKGDSQTKGSRDSTDKQVEGRSS